MAALAGCRAQFVVAPPAEGRTTIADLKFPLRWIDAGAVELVGPDELIVAGTGVGQHPGDGDERPDRQENRAVPQTSSLEFHERRIRRNRPDFYS